MVRISRSVEFMKAMVITGITGVFAGSSPLAQVELPVPEPGDGEILIELKERKIRGAKVLDMRLSSSSTTASASRSALMEPNPDPSS